MTDSALSAWIAERAIALGFDLCGVVSAQKFPELQHTEEWLAQGYAGEMSYLADPRRGDPRTAMPGIKSVIVCALNYNTPHPRSIHAAAAANGSSDVPTGAALDSPRGWISRYAWGRDYHEVLREKLGLLLAELQKNCGDSKDLGNSGDCGGSREPFVARIYADTGPVQERVLAKYAGLGWLGKNTLLLNQQLGSYFFLGVILTTLELVPTLPVSAAPPPDLCGSCRRCIDACPTNALQPYIMDARRCISYLTIELRGSIPPEFREAMGNNVFGCDICQDVCPWNNRAAVTQAQDFAPREVPWRASAKGSLEQGPNPDPNPDPSSDPSPDPNPDPSQVSAPSLKESSPVAMQSLLQPDLEWLASMTEAEFREVFRGSAIKRTKWRGLVRNACIALGNSVGHAAGDASLPAGPSANHPAYARVIATLERLAGSPEIHVAESAQWALARIQSQEPEHPVERGSH